MACVSLKRPLDLDPLEVLHSPNRRPPTKRQRCTPLKGLERDSTDAPMSPSSPAAPMPTTSSSLSPAEIANHLREILKPTKERRRIFDDNETLQRHSSNADIGPSVVGQLHAEKPIFTLKQMTTICEKICKDRIDRVRCEYDVILQQKLNEQYDYFVKFIDHQIQQRFSTQSQPPSYMS